MSKTIIFTEKAPKPLLAAYSQGVKAGGLIFVAGQPPIDPVTGEVVGVTIQEQMAQCLRNVQAILEVAGSSLDKAVSAAFIIADLNEFKGQPSPEAGYPSRSNLAGCAWRFQGLLPHLWP